MSDAEQLSLLQQAMLTYVRSSKYAARSVMRFTRPKVYEYAFWCSERLARKFSVLFLSPAIEIYTTSMFLFLLLSENISRLKPCLGDVKQMA